MQQLPDRHIPHVTHGPPGRDILPFSTRADAHLSSSEPIGLIDLDSTRLREQGGRRNASRGNFQRRRLEANLGQLIEELEFRFEELDARLTAALSVAEAE